nr:hypothetical protein [Pantoea cypripedii]
MASNWDKELEAHDSARSSSDDLRDSLRTIFKSAKAVASLIPDSKNGHGLDEVYEPLEQNGWKSGSQGYGFYRNGRKD